MRVIAGIAKGRILKSVEGDSTRPITDRTKEALFNIIGNDILQASFLDCFAGTGSVGIEALSRGSAFARFIEKNPRAISVIRENLKATGLINKAEVLRMDAFTALAKPPDREFDYIYVAPPQYHELWTKMLILLDNQIGWLSADGWIIVQIHPIEFEEFARAGQIKNIQQFDRRKYGSTLLLFFERAHSEVD